MSERPKVDQTALENLLYYGIDAQSRRVYLQGVLGSHDDPVGRWVTRSLQFLDQTQGRIELWICSPGGVTSEMFALYDVIRSLENKITTVGFGEVCSAACLLLVAGDYRVCTPNTYFMSHDDSWGIDGDRQLHREVIRIADRQAARWNDLMSRHTTCDASWWAEKTIEKRELWLDARQMLAHGIVDEIKADLPE